MTPPVGRRDDEMPAEAARRLLLLGLGLSASPTRRAGPAAIGRRIEQMGYVQVDTINIVARAHDHVLFSRFEVTLTESGLKARAWGETLDFDRHQVNHEVKAVTYHGLTVERTAEGWMAEVIFDI